MDSIPHVQTVRQHHWPSASASAAPALSVSRRYPLSDILSKAVQAPMLQAKPHQHEDLSHLMGKAKPHEAVVRNMAHPGQVGPQQRQHCLNCYICYCTSHEHSDFWCFLSKSPLQCPGPGCENLGFCHLAFNDWDFWASLLAELGFKTWAQNSWRKCSSR